MSWGDAVVAIVRWAGVGRPPSTIGENDDPEPDAPRDPATPDPDAVDVRARVDEAPCRRASVVRPGGAPTSPDAPTPSTVAVGGVVADPERIGLQPDAVLVALGRRAAERGDDRGARDWFEQAAWSEEAILRLAELDLRAGRADDALDRVEREREILSRAGSRPGPTPRRSPRTCSRRGGHGSRARPRSDSVISTSHVAGSAAPTTPLATAAPRASPRSPPHEAPCRPSSSGPDRHYPRGATPSRRDETPPSRDGPGDLSVARRGTCDHDRAADRLHGP